MATVYSIRVKGNKGNWNKPFRCDVTDGEYFGITQFDNATSEIVTDRILLTKKQMDVLVKFYNKTRK